MRLETNAIGLTALILVLLAYVLFGCVFLFRKKPPQTEEAKRAPAATFGIVLQGVSFVLVWNPPRPRWWPFPSSRAGEVALAAAAVILAYASCWLSVRAVQTLGKQWTYAARVIKGHELVTQGPYGVVRNPIYLGMFGLRVRPARPGFHPAALAMTRPVGLDLFPWTAPRKSGNRQGSLAQINVGDNRVYQAVARTSAFGETFDLLLPDSEFSESRMVAPCEFSWSFYLSAPPACP